MQAALPLHWKRMQLRDVCLTAPQNGAFIKNPKFGHGTRFVNVSDIYQDVSVDLDRVDRLECEMDFLQRYGLKENDILFVRSSLKREGVGRCCLVKWLKEPTIYDCHLIRVSPNTTLIDPLYLAQLLRNQTVNR